VKELLLSVLHILLSRAVGLVVGGRASQRKEEQDQKMRQTLSRNLKIRMDTNEISQKVEGPFGSLSFENEKENLPKQRSHSSEC